MCKMIIVTGVSGKPVRDAPLQGTPANFTINVILPETRVAAPVIVEVYLHSNFRGGLQKRMYLKQNA